MKPEQLFAKYAQAEALLAKAIQERERDVHITPQMSENDIKKLAKPNRNLIRVLQLGVTDDRKFYAETTNHFFHHGTIAKLLEHQDSPAIANLHRKLASFQELIQDAQAYLKTCIRLLQRQTSTTNIPEIVKDEEELKKTLHDFAQHVVSHYRNLFDEVLGATAKHQEPGEPRYIVNEPTFYSGNLYIFLKCFTAISAYVELIEKIEIVKAATPQEIRANLVDYLTKKSQEHSPIYWRDVLDIMYATLKRNESSQNKQVTSLSNFQLLYTIYPQAVKIWSAHNDLNLQPHEREMLKVWCDAVSAAEQESGRTERKISQWFTPERRYELHHLFNDQATIARVREQTLALAIPATTIEEAKATAITIYKSIEESFGSLEQTTAASAKKVHEAYCWLKNDCRAHHDREEIKQRYEGNFGALENPFFYPAALEITVNDMFLYERLKVTIFIEAMRIVVSEALAAQDEKLANLREEKTMPGVRISRYLMKTLPSEKYEQNKKELYPLFNLKLHPPEHHEEMAPKNAESWIDNQTFQQYLILMEKLFVSHTQLTDEEWKCNELVREKYTTPNAPWRDATYYNPMNRHTAVSVIKDYLALLQQLSKDAKYILDLACGVSNTIPYSLKEQLFPHNTYLGVDVDMKNLAVRYLITTHPDQFTGENLRKLIPIDDVEKVSPDLTRLDGYFHGNMFEPKLPPQSAFLIFLDWSFADDHPGNRHTGSEKRIHELLIEGGILINLDYGNCSIWQKKAGEMNRLELKK